MIKAMVACVRPDPDVLAEDIIENLEAAVSSFKEIMATINGKD